MTSVIDTLDRMEMGLCLRINRTSRRRGVRPFFGIVSRLGDGPFWLISAGAVLLLNGPTVVPDLVQAAATGGTGVLLYKAIKRRLGRERPFICNPAIDCGIPPLDRYSFPSGHTLHAVSFTWLLAALEPLLLPLLLPFAGLVAVSRIVLGLHYPSDVLAGALIGLLLAGGSILLL